LISDRSRSTATCSSASVAIQVNTAIRSQNSPLSELAVGLRSRFFDIVFSLSLMAPVDGAKDAPGPKSALSDGVETSCSGQDDAARRPSAAPALGPFQPTANTLPARPHPILEPRANALAYVDSGTDRK
jgi:hypothetical protein